MDKKEKSYFLERKRIYAMSTEDTSVDLELFLKRLRQVKGII